MVFSAVGNILCYCTYVLQCHMILSLFVSLTVLVVYRLGCVIDGGRLNYVVVHGKRERGESKQALICVNLF